MKSAYSSGLGASVELRATPFFQAQSFVVSFQETPAFNAPVDSVSLKHGRLHFCADSDSTLQSMTVNGQLLPARASVCKRVEGEFNDAIYAYRSKFCTNCQ